MKLVQPTNKENNMSFHKPQSIGNSSGTNFKGTTTKKTLPSKKTSGLFNSKVKKNSKTAG